MRPIHVIGGGLAGLGLGIALRRAGAPVAVVEAGAYPRHRVCGEFISGRGRAVLRELGLEQRLLQCGAREARSAAFFSGRRASGAFALPEPALCVSRYALDSFLADEFLRLGGELRENCRWRGGFAPGVVRATGRAPAPPGRWRWFGLKVHARNVPLHADLELHVLPSGYVGICRLDADTVNLCGLFRSRAAVPDLSINWRRWFDGPESSAIRRRLAAAEFLPGAFCSTAGLCMDPQRAAGHPECRLGDAITMIAPLTGNGMSMAFESAQIAAGPLLDYASDRASWTQTLSRVAAACDAAFRRRLRWSRRLQIAFFQPTLRDPLVWFASHSPPLFRQLFLRTR